MLTFDPCFEEPLLSFLTLTHKVPTTLSMVQEKHIGNPGNDQESDFGSLTKMSSQVFYETLIQTLNHNLDSVAQAHVIIFPAVLIAPAELISHLGILWCKNDVEVMSTKKHTFYIYRV